MPVSDEDERYGQLLRAHARCEQATREVKEKVDDLDKWITSTRTVLRVIGFIVGVCGATLIGGGVWLVRTTIVLEERQATTLEQLHSHEELPYHRGTDARLDDMRSELVQLQTEERQTRASLVRVVEAVEEIGKQGRRRR